MKKRTTSAGWTARILCIAAILFVSIFALDSFENGTILEKLADFGMHMIPSLILIVMLVIAWRNELAGGILIMLIGVGTAPFIYHLNYIRTQSVTICMEVIFMINLPFVITGALFLFSYYRLKKNRAAI